ncbi:MAG: glmS [Alphaproteobacteria bacterium]|jgi:glucosamine--fructose-6-phosphate aminotransferase (isomerizing)|nr:glmS [Alphaproteobacteria bacterium]
MCGIVGMISQGNVGPKLLEGLKRLEYRGYDSAGIATLTEKGIERRRAEGKLKKLQDLVAHSPIMGTLGIGHTRWATHGAPTQENAHPHASDQVAIVHNGIIENYADLKAMLVSKGHNFQSQTDTEVVVHLLTHYLDEGKTPLAAVRQALKELTGAFAFAIVFRDYADLMIVARRGSPLVIGYGDQEMSIGSDALALAPWTQQLCYLEEGDYALVTKDGAEIYDHTDTLVERPIRLSLLSGDTVGKGTYRHFMLKEVFEQPTAISDTLNSLLDQPTGTVYLPNLSFEWKDVSRLTIIGCGTAFLAGMTAKYWFEKFAHLPVDVEIASEFRYRDPHLTPGGVALFISQSGETIDTLCALQLALEKHHHTLAIVNTPESSMARQAKNVILTQAWPEIGVASTKAFTCQLAVLACLAIQAGQARGVLSEAQGHALVHSLLSAPSHILKVLQSDDKIHALAHHIHRAHSALYLGRGTNYPIALEGALKLKELSYIHAEGYPAGEMKHGPIALVDENVPVIVLAPQDAWFEKTLSNMQEVLARGASVICLTDEASEASIQSLGSKVTTFALPPTDPFMAPLVYTIPLQLLAYHTALLRGTDVDQPRNLAKSVTVE